MRRVRLLTGASFGLLVSASCTAIFLPKDRQVPTWLQLTPTQITVHDRGTAQLTLEVLDQYGEPIVQLPSVPEWTLTRPDLASIRNGQIHAERQGEGYVRVRLGTLQDSVPLVVLGVPRSLELVGASERSGVAGETLSDPVVVRVRDRHGHGVSNVPVRFNVIGGGGSVLRPSVLSDANGYAQNLWTLGSRAGTTNVLEVTSDSLRTERVALTATVRTGQIAQLRVVEGADQQGPVGQQLPQELVVQALDSSGNPVREAAIDWRLDGPGAGELVGSATDASGFARARWVLGTTAGQARAIVRPAGASTPEVSFRATAQPAGAGRLTILGGNNQTGPEGALLLDSLTVQLTDEHGNPIAGVPVTWEVLRGGGSIRASAPYTTRTNGTARAQWIAGISLPNSVRATAAGFSVVFDAAVRLGATRDTIRTASGLRYMELDLGPRTDTLVVAAGQVVAVHHSVYLASGSGSGTVLERIQKAADSPYRFEVGAGQVIAGYDEGVRGMRRGAIRRLIIPPGLAYGAQGEGAVPPNSTLVIDVEVAEIIP